MRFDTFSALKAISCRWPVERGKIIQTLLAISFGKRRGGFTVVNRLSEGTDLELIRGAQKFAIEVKTTDGTDVTLTEKDISGLSTKSRNDGYVPATAALRLQFSADWVIANAEKLAEGSYTTERLSLDSIPELEFIARIQFEKTTSELKDRVLKPPSGTPLEFLSTILLKESQ
jgi:Holliday junction resolvase